MSKNKDRQQKPQPTTAGEAVRHAHQQIAEMSDAQLEAAAEDIARRDDEQAIDALVAEIDRLKAELDAERSKHATEYNALSERAAKLRTDLLAVQTLVEDPASTVSIETEDGKAALKAVGHVLDQRKALHSDMDIISKAARHGAPPEGFEPKTPEGKEALEQVVLLGDIAKDQRERATDADAKWTRAVEDRDRLANELQATKDARGAVLPDAGWASNTAHQLVEAVPPHDRVLLLGDLLAQLLPHTGETGHNETASDVLKRALEERRKLTALTAEVERIHADLESRLAAQSERMVKIQSAMVARRAPDADWIAVRDTIAGFLSGTGLGGYGIVRGVEALVKEWQGLRAFFSEAPLTAVAVRDDGAKGPVRERFSLLVLSWDGKAVKTQVVEGTRPWGDISPYLDSTVRKHLIPGAYR